MTSDVPLYEGKPSLAIWLVLATFGFLVFAAITLFVLILPALAGRAAPAHWVIGLLTALIALIMYPWQVLDVRGRTHALGPTSITYSSGVLSRFSVEIPYHNIQAVSVRQGILQRIFDCGDVRLSVHGLAGPTAVTQADMNAIRIRSIPDFAELAVILHERINPKTPQTTMTGEDNQDTPT